MTSTSTSARCEAEPLCPNCRQPAQIIWVHGHGQCAACGVNTNPCCDGGAR